MRYAVLGADSFSGANFCNYLRECGDDVLSLGRASDIDTGLEHTLSIIKHHKPDYVVNFIAKGLVNESWDAPADWVRTNVMSTTKLVDALRHIGLVRYVHVSTPEVYGSGVHTEHSPFNPSTPYAVTKAAMEMMLQCFHRAYRFPVVITRSANVYGPGQQKRIIPLAIEAKRNGTVFQLQGDGKSLRSFIHIRDVCAATRLLAERGINGEAYNIATQRTTSMVELLDMIGCKYVSVPARRVMDANYTLITAKIRALDWTDTISLEDGLWK